MEEKKKKRKTVFLIIGCVLLVYVIPVLFILFIDLIYNQELEFKYENNNINIPKYEMNINVENEYYDQTKKCYVIETKSTNKLITKKLFTTYSLDIQIDFYDKEDYLVGTDYLHYEDLDKETKFKKSLTYCDEINTIDHFKVKKVNTY